jgi:leucoanthocyanidin reductase
VAGSDIGKFTVKAAYDPRAANKIVHFRPASNLLSTNEMASLWESKIGRTLPRETLSEDELLAMAAGSDSTAHLLSWTDYQLNCC